jgi:hypothetical protein
VIEKKDEKEEPKVELYKSNRIKTKSKTPEDYQITQQKWSNYLKKQTSNLKKITTTYLEHFFTFFH